MSTGLPKRFDPERLAAQEGGSWSGALDTACMPRLTDALASDKPATVSYSLQLRRDNARRLLIEGSVEADLECECQRCMEAVTLPVRSQLALAVVKDEEAARNLPENLEPLLLPPGAEVDLATLLEDELLLALPVIPMHPNAAECGERARYGRETEELDGDVKRENPFAVLKKLKNGNTD